MQDRTIGQAVGGAQKTSYRVSHLAKGDEYHAEFSRNPRRRLIWQLEQTALDRILTRQLGGRRIDYLDFACGTGRVLSFLEGRVDDSVGVDISPSMLEVAKQVTSRSTILQADLTCDDRLGSRTFDLVTAFRFFPNAEPVLRRAALTALTRHLKPGGFLVFNNHMATEGIQKRLLRAVTGGRRGVKGMSAAEVHDMVATAGLTITCTYHVGVVPEYEKLALRPRWLVAWIERLCTRLPLASLAEDVIYVCRRTAPERGERLAA